MAAPASLLPPCASPPPLAGWLRLPIVCALCLPADPPPVPLTAVLPEGDGPALVASHRLAATCACLVQASCMLAPFPFLRLRVLGNPAFPKLSRTLAWRAP